MNNELENILNEIDNEINTNKKITLTKKICDTLTDLNMDPFTAVDVLITIQKAIVKHIGKCIIKGDNQSEK